MPELVSAITAKLFEKGLERVLHQLLRRRTEVAQQILLSQLETGDAQIVDVADIDEVGAMLYEYMTAAQRGVARTNLRLMAQVLQKKIYAPPLYADDFLRWTSLLASLSREEIIAVTAFHEMKKRHAAERKENEKCELGRRELDKIIGDGKTFRNDEEFYRHISALTRTGLIMAHSGWGSLIYEPTDLMDEMLKLVDVEASLREPLR